MFSNDTQIRVRYGETDQMGYLHHSNYARYFEVARVELMRALGFPYGEMEKQGILMPVLHVNSKFLQPIWYDELVTVRAIITEMPLTRMKLKYEVYNGNGDLSSEGSTDLCFVDANTRKPMRCPDHIQELMDAVFQP